MNNSSIDWFKIFWFVSSLDFLPLCTTKIIRFDWEASEWWYWRTGDGGGMVY